MTEQLLQLPAESRKEPAEAIEGISAEVATLIDTMHALMEMFLNEVRVLGEAH